MPVDAFLTNYSTFLPNQAFIDTTIQALAGRQLLAINGQGKLEHWRVYQVEPSEGSLETKMQYIFGIFDDTTFSTAKHIKF